MFSRLEIWLSGEIFERAMVSRSAANASQRTNTGSSGGGDGNSLTSGSISTDMSSDIAAQYGALYASDVNGVVSLYGTLLRGVIMNILLIITNFIFLVMYNWEVAIATLCFLAMAVISGPTDLVGSAAKNVQGISTNGLGMLSEGVRSSSLTSSPSLDDDDDDDRTPAATTSVDSLCQQHNHEILVPLKKKLFSQAFYTNSVDTFINFFASFLTVIVVITMVWSVYDGTMEASQFLGVFFVFKELQKPAMKISGVLKSVIKKSANLERLNDTIFD